MVLCCMLLCYGGSSYKYNKTHTYICAHTTQSNLLPCCPLTLFELFVDYIHTQIARFQNCSAFAIASQMPIVCAPSHLLFNLRVVSCWYSCCCCGCFDISFEFNSKLPYQQCVSNVDVSCWAYIYWCICLTVYV